MRRVMADGFGKAEEPLFATQAASIDRTLRGPVCRGGVIRNWAAKTARVAQAGRKGRSVVLPELDGMTVVEQRPKDSQLLKAHLRSVGQHWVCAVDAAIEESGQPAPFLAGWARREFLWLLFGILCSMQVFDAVVVVLGTERKDGCLGKYLPR